MTFAKSVTAFFSISSNHYNSHFANNHLFFATRKRNFLDSLASKMTPFVSTFTPNFHISSQTLQTSVAGWITSIHDKCFLSKFPCLTFPVRPSLTISSFIRPHCKHETVLQNEIFRGFLLNNFFLSHVCNEVYKNSSLSACITSIVFPVSVLSPPLFLTDSQNSSFNTDCPNCTAFSLKSAEAFTRAALSFVQKAPSNNAFDTTLQTWATSPFWTLCTSESEIKSALWLPLPQNRTLEFVQNKL